MISPSPHITAPYQRVGWTDCFVVRAASVADGPQIGQVFWSGVIDRLTGRAPLSLRAVPDGQGHTALLWLPTSWWGEPTVALSLSLCLIAHGFLPSARSSSHAVVIVPPHTTQPHFLPLHRITVSFRWMYSHWLQALSYWKLFFDICKFTYCSE